jgi:hypothetical protein
MAENQRSTELSPQEPEPEPANLPAEVTDAGERLDAALSRILALETEIQLMRSQVSERRVSLTNIRPEKDDLRYLDAQSPSEVRLSEWVRPRTTKLVTGDRVPAGTLHGGSHFTTYRQNSPEVNETRPNPFVAPLPKRDLVRFDGNPLRYWLFIRSFESGILNRTNDPELRLSYLISLCDGEARRAIESCVILDPEEGFIDAMETLKRRFGRPHVIARAHINNLLHGPAIKVNDTDALSKLACEMKTCINTLSQLRYEADLNASVTVAAVVQRLPTSMQLEWSKRASRIFRNYREPEFKELYEFICENVDVAAAHEIYTSSGPCPATRSTRIDPRERHDPRNYRSTSLAVSSHQEANRNYRLCCLECGENHYLDQCQRFRSSSIERRRLFVADHQLCELCLKANHRADGCRTRNVCGLQGCQAKHHPLLHDLGDKQLQNTTPNVNTSFSVQGSVALGVVPVVIKGPSKTVTTYALLDSGSDCSFIKHDLARYLKIKTEPNNLTISTLGKRTQLQSSLASITLQSLCGTNKIEVKDVWTVKSLPAVERFVPNERQLLKWKHLNNINFPAVPNGTIGVLLGMNAPMAHWTLEHRYGGEDEPFAIRTPLGWTILGPVNQVASIALQANSIQGLRGSIDDKIEQLFNHEFDEIVSTKKAMSRDDQQALSIIEARITFHDGRFTIPLP